ncbi:MAG: hypothetical protein V1909_03675, partial [Candidatus Micrarchaeota archaeon]
MYTTIKISLDLKRKLDAMKIVDGETYEELLSDLVEDHLSINERTRAQLKKAIAGYRRGAVVS